MKQEEYGCSRTFRNPGRGSTSPADFISEVDIDNICEQRLRFRRSNCYIWWADNKERFRTLSKLAQYYLSDPPTPVPSEWLFSGAGEIYSDRCNRFAPERTEALLFIKNSFTLAMN